MLRLLKLSIPLLLFLIPPAYLSERRTQPQQNRRTVFRKREPDLYAPELYSDNLKLKVILVNLPGAENARSNWEVNYQVFFIPEDKYYEAVQHLPPGGSNPTPAQFSGKLLLAEGKVKKNGLATTQERTYVNDNIPFKIKVPDGQRTKFARLMTSYSVKIFDAKLNTTVYSAGIFTTLPFDDTSNESKVIPRDTLYLDFLVTPQGEIYRAQWPRKEGDTNWP